VRDKIVQGAVHALLTPVYEADFLDISFGARPGRSQQHALEALARGLEAIEVRLILDADLLAFFDSVDHAWLIRFLEHRIADARLIGLIGQSLVAGAVDEGQVMPSAAGLPQGGVVSPLLANVYLHYAYDLWMGRWARREAAGALVAVRWIDDTVVGFERRSDAERFVLELEERLARFGLALHPEKTRLIEFARPIAGVQAGAEPGVSASFDFLGLTHSWHRDPGDGRLRLERRRRDA
jgi:RNA-directed DNA polymerase